MTVRSRLLQFGLAALAPVVCLWGATQWAGAMLAYQPALGTPWINTEVVKIYAPWKLFQWWIAFDAQAPDVFARAGVAGRSRRYRQRCHRHRGSRLAGGPSGAKRQPMARPAGRTSPTSSRRSSLPSRGVVLGLYDGRYLRHDGPEHVLAVAPTRSGKGVGLVLPTLLSWTQSAVIHDIKGENWALTAGWRSRFSHCLLFDPDQPSLRPLQSAARSAQGAARGARCAEHRRHPGRSRRRPRAPRPLGEDRARAADRRHPARALRRRREDAGPRRHLPRRSRRARSCAPCRSCSPPTTSAPKSSRWRTRWSPRSPASCSTSRTTSAPAWSRPP